MLTRDVSLLGLPGTRLGPERPEVHILMVARFPITILVLKTIDAHRRFTTGDIRKHVTQHHYVKP